MEEKTLGEIIVRTEFNPSKNSLVDDIKQRTAELINLVNCLPNSTNPEVRKLQGCAINNYELAAMLAAKAATA